MESEASSFKNGVDDIDTLTERENAILDYMSGRIGKSLDILDSKADEMLKFVSGILTVLSVIAAYFKISASYLILPIILMVIGIIGFIKTIEPKKMIFFPGEINSAINSYNKMVRNKHFWIKTGYASAYVGFIYFIIVIILAH